ncbi:Laccase-4 [Hibiscus syriacus]|uniref:Laccase-4 n=1 Tax=Hibiscus syriacus TaxID=106335 RepID=A0A6A3BLD4_HIBSY|nr:Laccase-4 [Hibiscus syriacus]
MNSWVRILVLIAFLFPVLVDSAVRHYKFNLRTGWADGLTYITQCPIQIGQSYVYNFTVTGQRGTLLWHAHILWLRSTVHGAIVILPKAGVPYQFPKPDDEVVIVLGERWKSYIEDVINEALKSGLAPYVSDAHKINGHPGPISNCPSREGFTLPVENGKTYMLRLFNTTLNKKLFFKIVGHKLTVFEVDATYVKPFKIDTIGTLANTATTLTTPPLQNATPIANSFTNSLRALNSKKYPVLVPRAVVAINNMTFVMPTTDLLQAHYLNISGVFTADFPGYKRIDTK